jgi:hypothetical protein
MAIWVGVVSLKRSKIKQREREEKREKPRVFLLSPLAERERERQREGEREKREADRGLILARFAGPARDGGQVPEPAAEDRGPHP